MSAPAMEAVSNRALRQAETPHCDRCDAVCCRLTVVLMPEDKVPQRFTTHNEYGVAVMARDDEGWCVAIDQGQMCCSIYEQRPSICRKFPMAGPGCREVQADYLDRRQRGIPLVMY